MRYLDSLVGLSVLYLAQGVFASTKLDNSSTPLCRSLQEKSVADAEYHTSVTSWIQTRLDDFHDHYGSDSDVSFQDNLTSTYAPDVAASMAHCSPGELCSVVSCRFISGNFNLSDQRNAFLALELYAKINKAELMYRAAANEAFGGLNAGLGHMMSQFTDNANWKAHQEQVHFMQKLWLQFGATTAMIAAAVAGPAASLAIPAMQAANMLTLIGKTSAEMLPKILGAEVNVIVGAYIGGKGLGELTISSKEPDAARQQTQELLSKTLMLYHQISGDVITKNLEVLYKGQKNNKGWDITEYAKYENHTKSMDRTIGVDNQFRKLWAAAIIGPLWQLERTYIVWADAPSGCENDKRGPAHLRVCLDNHSKAVFYPYFISRTREGSAHQALVQGPPGHEHLSEYGLTLKDIVVASVEHYKEFKFGTFDFQQKDAFLKWTAPDAAQNGGDYRGLLTIPICRNPGGEAIAAVDLKEGINYPCMCGMYNWHDGYSPNLDETEQFLNVTTYGESGDMKRRCDHKQNCKENHDIDWDFGKIKHPWKRCEYDSKRPTSCEHPNHDGVHENKNC